MMCSAARRRAVGLGVRGGRGSTGTVSHRGRIIRAAWSRVTGTVTITVVRVPGTSPIQSVTVGKHFVHFWDSSLRLFRSPCGQWTSESLWQLEVAGDTLTVA
jgi:hypothetical protein